MRILLLKIALIPHHIWAVLWTIATAIDKAYFWLKRKPWRKPKVYGYKRHPEGGNYFDDEAAA